MTTETYQIRVRDLQVEVVNKDIKNLHIKVYPPDGRVRVSAPLHMSEESIRLAIVSKLSRILREIKIFAGYDRESRREMVSGESHYFEGHRYLLELIEDDKPPSISIRGKKALELRVRPGSDREKREKVLNDWYRIELRQRLDVLIPMWESKTGIKVEFSGIKRMKTKWGSCKSDSKRIWLNLELMKKPPMCVEYVLVHEMIHILEPVHSDRFYQLLERFMPTWRLHQDLLDEPPLVHCDWAL